MLRQYLLEKKKDLNLALFLPEKKIHCKDLVKVFSCNVFWEKPCKITDRISQIPLLFQDFFKYYSEKMYS